MSKNEKFQLLSRREQIVIQTLIEHPTFSNEAIAKKLNKDLKTIEHQLRSSYKRLNITGDPCQKRISIILMFRSNESQQCQNSEANTNP